MKKNVGVAGEPDASAAGCVSSPVGTGGATVQSISIGSTIKYLPPTTAIKFKKLRLDAKAPTKATDGACGFDLTAVGKQKVYNSSGVLKYISYSTGIAVEIPKGYCGLAIPRSSVSNLPLFLANGVGLIDNDYRGEITFRFKTDYTSTNEYNDGDRIGQLLILPLPTLVMIEAEELSKTERADKGYGSTGEDNLGG